MEVDVVVDVVAEVVVVVVEEVVVVEDEELEGSSAIPISTQG